ncbi:N-acetyltransferase [Lelliottia sp. RWM.1]|uniref:GNAT family N-acetyltransferase n=1 Tax=Lelliottia sp. RWM.1 TaxID=2663242 RepID=UPI00193CD405|nr:GNAT family N-acetyltransferase [Lelliottia sp. RWM.1]MBM3073094.1 GNAT family N-acetyltransferase [Lelliottia sp. RWM.1]
MELTAVSALHFSVAELTGILERCFQDYFVPFSLTPEAFALRFSSEGVSLEASRVWLRGDEPVAIALINRRANTARLGAFAIIPAYRGKGLARGLLSPLCESIKAQGITHFYLEVLRENSAAIALYRSLGFHLTQGLWGFKGDVRGVHINGELNAATTDELLRAVWSAPAEHIPWQLDPLSLPLLPCQVFREDSGAWAAITTNAPIPQLRFLFVEPTSRGQGHARQMLQHLNARYPGISTPVAVPEHFAPLFAAAGYQPLAITQYGMVQR